MLQGGDMVKAELLEHYPLIPIEIGDPGGWIPDFSQDLFDMALNLLSD